MSNSEHWGARFYRTVYVATRTSKGPLAATAPGTFQNANTHFILKKTNSVYAAVLQPAVVLPAPNRWPATKYQTQSATPKSIPEVHSH